MATGIKNGGYQIGPLVAICQKAKSSNYFCMMTTGKNMNSLPINKLLNIQDGQLESKLMQVTFARWHCAASVYQVDQGNGKKHHLDEQMQDSYFDTRTKMTMGGV